MVIGTQWEVDVKNEKYHFEMCYVRDFSWKQVNINAIKPRGGLDLIYLSFGSVVIEN